VGTDELFWHWSYWEHRLLVVLLATSAVENMYKLLGSWLDYGVVGNKDEPKTPFWEIIMQ
jgi:hypothetical protein